MRSNMASIDSAPTKRRRVQEQQQSLLKSGPFIEVSEVQRKNAEASPGLEFGLCHRLKRITMEYDVISDDEQEHCLLGNQTATSALRGLKRQHGFSKCMEKYFSACKLNMDTLIGKKRRRESRSEKSVGPRHNTQMDSEGADRSKVPCLGRGWTGVRKRLGEMIKIEEDIVTSVTRSVLYYA